MAGGQVMQVVVEMAGNLSPTLGKSIEEATSKLGGINVKALAAGAAVGGIAVAAGKALIEGGKYLADLGGKFDAATDAIRIGTGATGEDLDALMGDFNEVYKSVPTSMEDASKAIADYNTRLGLTGPELQGISKQALQVSDMLGEDLGGVIEGSSKAFQQWNIDAADMGGAMDYVFKVSQSTGVGFTDLMDKVQKFGPQLQDMGYSFEEATALIGQLDKAGVNTDEVLGAMKKSVGNLAKEGISASDGLQMYYEKIQAAGSEAEAAAIASEIFGAKAGSTMAAAIRDGTLSVDDLTSSLEANGETINGAAEDTYDFAERLQMFKQNAEVALQPLANTVFDGLNSLMPVVQQGLEALAPVITQVTEVAGPLISDFFAKLVEYLGPILPMIAQLAGDLIQQLLPPLMELFNAIMPVVFELLQALMPILQVIIDLIGPILNLTLQLLTPILSLITECIAPLIEVIGQLIAAAIEPLMPLIQILASLFSDRLSSAISSIQPIIDSVIAIFSGLIDFIKNVFTGNWSGAWEAVKNIFSNIISGLGNIFKAPINFIIGGINTFLGALNKIKIPDWVPLVGGMGFNIPLIPTLAAGGFTDGISIAGEAGMEAVISFDPAYRRQNLAYWAEAGQMLGAYDNSGTSSGGLCASAGRLLALDDFSLGEMAQGTTVIIYDFSGLIYSPQISGDAGEDDELMAKLKAHAAEFFDWLEDWLNTRREGRYATYNVVY